MVKLKGRASGAQKDLARLYDEREKKDVRNEGDRRCRR